MTEEAGTERATATGRLPHFRLVEVQWVDAFNLAAGWRDIAEIAKDADDQIRNWSAGYLIAETESAIAITVAVNHDFEQAAGGLTVIPRVQILTIRDLRRGTIRHVADRSAGPPQTDPQPVEGSAPLDDTGGAAAANGEPGTRSAPDRTEATGQTDADAMRDSGPRTGAAVAVRLSSRPNPSKSPLTRV